MADAPPDDDIAVALRGVSFWYPGAPADRPALRDVHVVLRRGAAVLLCGPSGGGKSTLLRLLLGLVPQLSGGRLAGDLEVLGRDPTQVPPHDMATAGIGLLFQNPVEGFVAEHVLDEVAFGPENIGLEVTQVESRAVRALEAVGLGGFERRRLRTLSTGQQQRVALASALALRPRLLVLDEPTAHLDEHTARDVLRLVFSTVRGQSMTLLVSEHRVGAVAPLVDEAWVLVDGQLVRAGPPRQVLADESLVNRGVPVPRAAQVALALDLGEPLPLTAAELCDAVVSRGLAAQPRMPPQVSVRQPAERLLQFEGVSYTYPGNAEAAVEDVSFALRAGEIDVLMGATGAGKSTLARLALGLLRPSAGSVSLCGLRTDRTPFGQLAAHGGLVLQNPLLQLLAPTVDAELRLGLIGCSRAEQDRRVSEMLETFTLGEVRYRHPLALSEGQRRRVALAATLARRPRVLVLDEPTLGQDELQRVALEDVLRDFVGEGSAVLCISHDVEFVADIADRVLALNSGRLRADVAFDDNAGAIEAAGVPLGDVPAAVLELRQHGLTVPPARGVRDLVSALT